MTKFKHLVLQDFRSFVGKHDLPLDDKGLFLIKGRNLDTQGESGAGKSTIFIAIGYALGCSPFSGKDLTNWYSEKTQVVLSLTVADKPMQVFRGAVNKIVYEDREVTGAKQIDAELDTVFGIDSGQRASVLYKDQGLGDYFLNKTNSEKRDFIVSVLGIDEFERQITIINQDISQKTTKQGYVAKEVDATAYYLTKEREKAAALKVPAKLEVDSTLEGRIKDNDDKIMSLSSQLDLLEEADREETLATKTEVAKLQSEVASCLKDQRILDIEKSVQIAEFNKVTLTERSMALNKQISEARVNSHKRLVLERSISELSEFLETTDVGTCPTCRQMWDSGDLIKAKTEELARKQSELDALPVFDLDELVFIEKDTKLAFHVEDQRIGSLRSAKVEAIEQLQKDLLVRIRELQSTPTRNSSAIKAIKDELAILTRAKGSLSYEQTNALLRQNEYDKAQAVYEANKKNAEAQVATLEQKKREIDAENDNLLKSLAFLNEKVEFTKGFLYNIFHDMLEELTSETNAILSKIPNVAHITVSFTSERETKKGEVKQELVAKINVNGSERPLKSGCSGGMISAVQLATDLALRKLLSRRAQKDWGILMIDEQFGGLDLVSKTCCMEVLKDFSQSCLVMVIDHHTEINEYSDQIIEVEYENGRSIIA